MNTIAIDNDFHIAPQIGHGDIKMIAEKGFTTIINNRPDNEQAGQPLSKALEIEAKKLGLMYHHIPILPGKATIEDVHNFKRALAESSGPVLGFCKTGMRAKSMHAACQPN